MNYRSFLIKYAEIGVKGKNRYLFEDALVKQIHHRLKRLEGGFTVTKAVSYTHLTLPTKA